MLPPVGGDPVNSSGRTILVMPVAALVSVEEYLNTSYRPDCDYVDGEVLERILGGRKHSRLQREIMFYLGLRYPELRDRLFPEQRVKVSATRFRIPDICILAEDSPDDEVVLIAPVLCIEILSPEDTMTRTMVRVKDYFAMGVPVCWIIDPATREGWIATPGHLDDATDCILRAEGIEMPLSEVLSA
jgi:Uma2 family endonuclease